LIGESWASTEFDRKSWKMKIPDKSIDTKNIRWWIVAFPIHCRFLLTPLLVQLLLSFLSKYRLSCSFPWLRTGLHIICAISTVQKIVKFAATFSGKVCLLGWKSHGKIAEFYFCSRSLRRLFCHKLRLTYFFRLRFDQLNFFPAEIRLEEFPADFRLISGWTYRRSYTVLFITRPVTKCVRYFSAFEITNLWRYKSRLLCPRP